jgi:hypothetical protein
LPRRAAKERQRPPFGDVGEEVSIDLLDDRDRAHRDLRSELGHVQPTCACVSPVEFTVD